MIIDSATVKCDTCGVTANHPVRFWPEGWQTENGHHYCPKHASLDATDWKKNYIALYDHLACKVKGCDDCLNGVVAVVYPLTQSLDDCPRVKDGGALYSWVFGQHSYRGLIDGYSMTRHREDLSAKRGVKLYETWYESLTQDEQSDVDEMNSERQRYW